MDVGDDGKRFEMGMISGAMGNSGRMDPQLIHQEYARLLGTGEQFQAGYQLVRDAFLFTNRRLIFVDKQGVTGRKIEYHSVLYRAITHFAVETAGTFDLDAELRIWISGAQSPIQRRFSRAVDIYEVQAVLAHFVAGG